MHKGILRAGIAVLAFGSAAAPSFAQEAVELDEVIVTSPNRAPTDKDKVGSKVETVDKKEIEAKSQPLVLDYLNLLPGVAISSTGGPGSEGTLAIRGLQRRYVKTLFNGIDIADPTGTQTQTAYQYLLTGGMDNIEVLKGSQSTMYGSEAIAGVISLNTLGGVTQGIRHELDLEGGSFGTVAGRYGLKAANERSKLALNVTGLTTDGFSAAPGGVEKDGFENGQADANFEARVNEALSVFGSALYIDGDAAYDDFASGVGATDNPNNFNLTKQKAVRAGFNVDLLDGRLKNTFSAQLFEVDRAIRSDHPVFGRFDADYLGNREKVDYQGSFEATDWLLLQYGAEHERQSAAVTDNYGTDSDDSFTNTAAWGQVVLEPVQNLSLTASVRQDEHSEFGGYTSYRLTGSYLYEPSGTRLHTSYGTGFRAPSMYELYDPFSGSEILTPETSASFDVGVEQRFMSERLLVDVTYFNIAVEDQIQWRPIPGTFGGVYENIPGTSRSQGVEASFTYETTEWLNLGGSYTYTDSRTEAGDRNARIPEHAIVLSAVAEPAEKWSVSADVKFALDSVDNGQVPLDDYILLNAKIAYKPNENMELYVRGANLLDQDYQTAKGYATPGIAGFAGVKLRY